MTDRTPLTPTRTPAETPPTQDHSVEPFIDPASSSLNTSIKELQNAESDLQGKDRLHVFRDSFQTVRNVFAYLPLNLKIKTALMAAIDTVTMSQAVMTAYFTKCLVDKMSSSPGVLPKMELALVIGSGFAFEIGRYFSGLMVNRTHNDLDNNLESVFMNGIANQPLMVTKTSKYQGKLEAAKNFNEVTGVILKGFGIASGGVQIVVAAVAMSSIHWGVTFGVLLSCVPSLWASLKQAKQQIALSEENQKLWPAFNARRNFFLDPGGFKELVVLDKQADMAKRITTDNTFLNERGYQTNKMFAGYNLITNFSTEIGVGLAMLYTVYQISKGTATVGDMTLVTGAASALIFSVAGMARTISAYAKNIYTAGLFIEVVTPAPSRRREGESKVMEHTPRISVDIHEFGYPPEGEIGDYKSVLRDINFVIEPSQFVAVVGKNGQGKSSLINILTGVYEPVSGSVKIDSEDLNTLASGQWYSNIGVLEQDFRLIGSLSIRENIAMGQKPGKDNLTVEEAAEMAGLNTFLSGLTDGLDTVYGQGAGGRDFSGGEEQKIALARALVSMPKVLFLDEPTASIDKAAEKKLFKTIDELRHTRNWKPTIVYISHTFARVRKADKIIVISGGEIEAIGTHDELMKNPEGTYPMLFNLDAEAYDN